MFLSVLKYIMKNKIFPLLNNKYLLHFLYWDTLNHEGKCSIGLKISFDPWNAYFTNHKLVIFEQSFDLETPILLVKSNNLFGQNLEINNYKK